MPTKKNAVQIASRNLGWNIYFSRNLVEASLEHYPGHRQRQNSLTQVTLGQGLMCFLIINGGLGTTAITRLWMGRAACLSREMRARQGLTWRRRDPWITR